MSEIFMPLVILIPVICGILILFLPFKKRCYMLIYTELVVIVNTFLVWMILCNRPDSGFTLMKITGDLTICFQLDGLGSVFAGLVSFLWPLATLYAFEYMKQESHEKVFLVFYTVTYGVTLGIAFASNLITMYFFYELLTLVTVPLVIHTLTKEAVLAARKYLYYSLGGAAFAFLSVIFMIVYSTGEGFTLGGTLSPSKVGDQGNILLLIYVFAFFGFGVKAALCPFNSWLPRAGAAPTPVTALLHAVAVVKSGAFAIMRLTYYCFGTEFLKGTWAQNVVMLAAMITIVYGCSMAVKERHLKRRLAYSTISNLSYILFGVTIMTPLGLAGALSHLVFHGVMKICSFFCAGAVIYKTGKTYVYELDGLGKKMPGVFGIFTVSAFALMGVPGLCGFISKYNLAEAARESGNIIARFGIGALLISALLTAAYMFSIIIRAFFPADGFDFEAIKGVKDPNWLMMVPLGIFVVVMFYFGLHSGTIVELFTNIAAGKF